MIFQNHKTVLLASAFASLASFSNFVQAESIFKDAGPSVTDLLPWEKEGDLTTAKSGVANLVGMDAAVGNLIRSNLGKDQDGNLKWKNVPNGDTVIYRSVEKGFDLRRNPQKEIFIQRTALTEADFLITHENQPMPKMGYLDLAKLMRADNKFKAAYNKMKKPEKDKMQALLKVMERNYHTLFGGKFIAFKGELGSASDLMGRLVSPKIIVLSIQPKGVKETAQEKEMSQTFGYVITNLREAVAEPFTLQDSEKGKVKVKLKSGHFKAIPIIESPYVKEVDFEKALFSAQLMESLGIMDTWKQGLDTVCAPQPQDSEAYKYVISAIHSGYSEILARTKQALLLLIEEKVKINPTDKRGIFSVEGMDFKDIVLPKNQNATLEKNAGQKTNQITLIQKAENQFVSFKLRPQNEKAV